MSENPKFKNLANVLGISPEDEERFNSIIKDSLDYSRRTGYEASFEYYHSKCDYFDREFTDVHESISAYEAPTEVALELSTEHRLIFQAHTHPNQIASPTLADIEFLCATQGPDVYNLILTNKWKTLYKVARGTLAYRQCKDLFDEWSKSSQNYNQDRFDRLRDSLYHTLRCNVLPVEESYDKAICDMDFLVF